MTVAEFDASANLPEAGLARILPRSDASTHALFENIMIDLTWRSSRAFAREGFHLEEETNWRQEL